MKRNSQLLKFKEEGGERVRKRREKKDRSRDVVGALETVARERRTFPSREMRRHLWV